MDNLSIEREFLAACLRSQWDAQAVTDARQIVSKEMFDWKKCQSIIADESISPLISQRCEGKIEFPGDIDESLKALNEKLRLRNFAFFSGLRDVLKLIEHQKIPSIVLKGSALSIDVYADKTIRPVSDVDILIREIDLRDVLSILYAEGFDVARPSFRGLHSSKYENEILLVRMKPIYLPLELHWSLFDSPFYQNVLDHQWIWDSRAPLDFFGQVTSRLSDSAQLLHLCGHLELHHSGYELLFLNDIARFIHTKADHLDWEEILQRTKENKLILPVKKVLREIFYRWKVPMPESFLNQLESCEPGKTEERVYRMLTSTSRSAAIRLVDDLSVISGVKGKLSFILGNLFPSREYMQARYQIGTATLIPLYYPFRWWLGIKGVLFGEKK
jgi:hypothetical protein